VGNECTKVIERCEVKEPRSLPDSGATVCLNEVNDPIVVVLEIHQDLGHGYGSFRVCTFVGLEMERLNDWKGNPKKTSLGRYRLCSPQSWHLTAMLSQGKLLTPAGMDREHPLQVTTQLVGLGPVCWV
jgi:hypothetical protein